MKPADVIDIVEKVIVPRAKGDKRSYCLFIRYSHLVLEVLTIGAKPGYSSLLSLSSKTIRNIRITNFTNDSCNLFGSSTVSVENFSEDDAERWSAGKGALEEVLAKADRDKAIEYASFRRVMFLILGRKSVESLRKDR